MYIKVHIIYLVLFIINLMITNSFVRLEAKGVYSEKIERIGSLLTYKGAFVYYTTILILTLFGFVRVAFILVLLIIESVKNLWNYILKSKKEA